MVDSRAGAITAGGAARDEEALGGGRAAPTGDKAAAGGEPAPARGEPAPARGEPAPAGLERIWTVPNALSVGRLVLLGLFCWLLFGPGDRVAASILLAVTGATDFLDGFVARRFNQVTTLGKVLDPTADRIVVATGVIAITVYGAVPGWLAGLVLGREAAISAAVLALAGLKARRIDVLFVGKAGTFGLMACFPMFLLSYSPAGWAVALRETTWVLVVPALALSFSAAAAYVPAARRALAERRAPQPEVP